MLQWIPQVPAFFELVILVAGFVAAVYALKKGVYNPIRDAVGKLNRGMDTLLGYGAVLDPASGKEIQPPTPPLAERVNTLEDAVHKLVDFQALQIAHTERIEAFDQRLNRLESNSTQWQKEHEALHLLSHEINKDLG